MAPIASYFDDSASFPPDNVVAIALGVFTIFCTSLRTALKPGKSEAGAHVTFLRLRGRFPSRSNSFRLGISLPAEKSSCWSRSIAGHIKDRPISHQHLEKLIGKLCLNQTHLFAKFARAQLRPPYRRLYRKVYMEKPTLLGRRNLRWWESITKSMAPRWVAIRPTKAPWIVYTDTATHPHKISALLFDGGASSISLAGQWADDVPQNWVHLLRKTSLIFGLELLASVAFVEQVAPRLAGQCVWIYVDNNNVSEAISRGDSNTDVIAELVARLWETLRMFPHLYFVQKGPFQAKPS